MNTKRNNFINVRRMIGMKVHSSIGKYIGLIVGVERSCFIVNIKPFPLWPYSSEVELSHNEIDYIAGKNIFLESPSSGLEILSLNNSIDEQDLAFSK